MFKDDNVSKTFRSETNFRIKETSYLEQMYSNRSMHGVAEEILRMLLATAEGGHRELSRTSTCGYKWPWKRMLKHGQRTEN